MIQATKEFKREDGKKYEITAKYATFGLPYDKSDWDINVYYKNKGQRDWRAIFNTTDFDYRKLSTTERQQYTLNRYLEHVTKEEIMQVCELAWQSIKPTPEQVFKVLEAVVE